MPYKIKDYLTKENTDSINNKENVKLVLNGYCHARANQEERKRACDLLQLKNQQANNINPIQS